LQNPLPIFEKLTKNRTTKAESAKEREKSNKDMKGE
jgi:hypothetical protein